MEIIRGAGGKELTEEQLAQLKEMDSDDAMIIWQLIKRLQ